jgi:hypothetical protein
MKRLLAVSLLVIIFLNASAQSQIVKDFKPACDSLRTLLVEKTSVQGSLKIKSILKRDGKLDFFRLLFYFTHRYLAPSIYDARWAERLLLSATLSLSLYFLSFSEGIPLTEAAVDFSASIEYSSENIEGLLDYISDRFS